MEFNIMGLIPLIFIIWIGILAYKLGKYILTDKPKKVKKVLWWLAWPLIILIILINFTPVKLTEDNMSRYEETNKFDNIPDRIIVEEKSFSETQKIEFDKLKKESNNEEI